MAVALPGKCVALLGLVVLLYATCYGFRIRDVAPQTSHPSAAAVCVSAHGRACPDDRITPTTTTTTTTTTKVTGGPTFSTRKWHDGAVPSRGIVIGDHRKPPAEPHDGTDGTGPRIERSVERARDGSATRDFKRTKSVEVDDDEEEAVVEVEDEEEEEEKDDRSDGEDDEDEKGVSEDEEERTKVKKEEKFVRDEDDDESEDNDDDDDDDDDDKDIGERFLKRDTKKQAEKIKMQVKTAKANIKSMKYSKSKIGDDDDEDVEEEKEQIVTKTEQRVAAGASEKQAGVSLKKHDQSKVQISRSDDDDEDEDEKEEEGNGVADMKDATPVARKFEKVRFADKDKVKAAKILPGEPVAERPEEQPEKGKPDDLAKPAVKKGTEERAKGSVEATRKPVESAKKSAERSARKAEPAKLAATKPKAEAPKAEVPKTATKVDEEKSRPRAKPTETPTPAPSKLERQAKRPEKADVKRAAVPTARPTSKPTTGEASREKKRETKPTKTREDTDAASVTLSELNDAILRLPTFVPNFMNVEDPECQQHGKIFLRQLRGHKLWALQMLDSSAKIPSGLLRGNVNQLGDYDQCLGVLAHVKIDEKTIRVQGKYCLAAVDLQASHPDMKLPVNLMQARAFIRGNMHDPGHFIPKFTTVNWALCLPAACSAKDAERALEGALRDYNATVGIKFTADVDPNMCYVKQKSQSYSKETIGVLYFYAMIICLVIVATVRDYLVVAQGKGNYSERIIMSFSLRRTIKALLKEGTDGADITCIHGIRALATVVLYVAHQLIIISRIPFSNRASLTEIANSPASSVLRVSLVYTDAFLLLSGVLTAYNMARELKTRGEIRWFCRFVARFIRLTPALLAVVFWYAFVMEHVGSGPQWNSVVATNAELCKYNAWTNLLYVQNFFPFEEMCATHTHQLALDMQLSLLAPILVFFLQYKLLVGILLMVFLVLLSATLRYVATMSNYLSLVIFHGISSKRLYKTANLTYALPLHRATPYVFGVGLGVLLHHTGKNVRLHRALVISGWLIAALLGSWSLFSPWRTARRDYVYDAEEATHYAVIGPILWAMALCWSIFACFTGHGGAADRFLSSHRLVIFSRISYAVYLTQFAVFFHNVGSARYSAEFQLYRAIDPLEVAIVVAASVVLTLLFDLPMQEVRSVIMESTDALALDAPSEDRKTSAAVNNKDESATVTTSATDASVFEDRDEIAPTTGRNWWLKEGVARGATDPQELTLNASPTLKRANGGRGTSFVARESRADDRGGVKWGGASGRRRYATDDSEEEAAELPWYHQQRNSGHSLSRTKEIGGRSASSREVETSDAEDDAEARQRRSEGSKGRTAPSAPSVVADADDYRSWEFVGGESSATSRQFARPPPTTTTATYGLARSAEAARRTFLSTTESEEEDDGAAERVVPDATETRTSDEEEWERELRTRRRQFMERLLIVQRRDRFSPGEEGEEEEVVRDEGRAEGASGTGAKRRSSAEGRIALLSDDLTTGEDGMDSWTVSVGEPRIALLVALGGSSQEPSEPEEDGAGYARRRVPREYRERGPPSREESEEESSRDTSRPPSFTSGSQKTSLEEEEGEGTAADDVNSRNFVLTQGSKRESLQDLSRLSQEELADSGWNVVRREEGADRSARPTPTVGLFKRESIVRSQASEEDPEYLLPERPKLVQQEREHPFKKAWQMQKSRSEEDGSAAYAIKDPAAGAERQRAETKEPGAREEDRGGSPATIERERGGEQSSEDVGWWSADQAVEATVVLRRGSDTTEGTGTTGSEGTDERSESVSTGRGSGGVARSESSRSETDEDSAKFNWPGDEEAEEEEMAEEDRRYGRRGRWSDWEQEET